MMIVYNLYDIRCFSILGGLYELENKIGKRTLKCEKLEFEGFLGI
jgi:hypothetical protein